MPAIFSFAFPTQCQGSLLQGHKRYPNRGFRRSYSFSRINRSLV